MSDLMRLFLLLAFVIAISGLAFYLSALLSRGAESMAEDLTDEEDGDGA